MTRCIKSATEPVLLDQVLLVSYPDSLGFLWPCPVTLACIAVLLLLLLCTRKSLEKEKKKATGADLIGCSKPEVLRGYLPLVGDLWISLLRQIFPTQESNQGLLHCRQILYQLSYQGSPLMNTRVWNSSSLDLGQNKLWGTAYIPASPVESGWSYPLWNFVYNHTFAWLLVFPLWEVLPS